MKPDKAYDKAYDKVSDIFKEIQKLSPNELEDLNSRIKQAEKEKEIVDLLKNIAKEALECVKTKSYQNKESFETAIQEIKTSANDLKHYAY